MHTQDLIINAILWLTVSPALNNVRFFFKKSFHSFISACTIFAAVACAITALSMARNLALTRST
jgi:hypothetical protein